MQSNGAGIDGIYFVEASTNKVIEFESVSTPQDIDSIRSFLAGDREQGVSGPSSPQTPSGPTDGVRVTIYENGEQVDSFVLNGTATIEVQPVNNSTV